jgi:hypothetical protein
LNIAEELFRIEPFHIGRSMQHEVLTLPRITGKSLCQMMAHRVKAGPGGQGQK